MMNSRKEEEDRLMAQHEKEIKEAREKEFQMVIYNQFHEYIEDLFSKKPAYSSTELNAILARDFPNYKPGHIRKYSLLMDLLYARVVYPRPNDMYELNKDFPN